MGITIDERERLDEAAGRATCEANGYTDYTRFPNGRDAAITRMLFTHAILADLTRWGYGDRWCYHSVWDAMEALAEWAQRGGEGEPEGWRRHPSTGRRRENGDPSTEVIAP
ncbi:hypothetical protein P0D88_34830 [Paraburkholderia sp. RL18-103-BIB-C]|uniref:hypothetical protein n=1 Tax=Paraburkholderia sp. RL18-103-BIB-C TaxID=3031637 RepID=UPI0038BD26FE